MSLRPLAGASYHTIDTVPLFTYPDVDLEATGSSDAYKHHIYTYKGRHSPLNQTPASRTSHRRGPPVLLVLLLLCCLAFVATALTGYPTNRVLHLPDVPEGHARLANNISAVLQVQPYRSMVEANYEGALEILYVYHRCAFVFLTAYLVRIGGRNSIVRVSQVIRLICGSICGRLFLPCTWHLDS